jgi:ComF family protein
MFPLLFSQALNWLLPPSPQSALLRSITTTTVQSLYHPQSIAHHHQALTQYQHPVIKALIIRNKFHDDSIAADHLGYLLSMWLQACRAPVVIIPVPLSRRREHERGYNQVTRIAHQAKKYSPTITLVTDILSRTRHTSTQTSLSREARLSNVAGAFTVSNSHLLSQYDSSTIVILDDVLTTGATLTAARTTLAPHIPPSATLLTIAIAH